MTLGTGLLCKGGRATSVSCKLDGILREFAVKFHEFVGKFYENAVKLLRYIRNSCGRASVSTRESIACTSSPDSVCVAVFCIQRNIMV